MMSCTSSRWIDRFELRCVVGADVEDCGLVFHLERIEADGEEHDLSGAPRRFEQASGICVETGRGVGVDDADMIGIAVIGSDTAQTILNVRRLEVTLIERLSATSSE